MHARAALREAIANVALANVAPLLGDEKVYTTRRPITRAPALRVLSAAERMQVENPGYMNEPVKRYRRFYTVSIEAIVSPDVDSPDTDTQADLDALCLLVEHAMAAYGLATDGVITIDLITVNFAGEDDAETELELAEMNYEIEYRTAADDVETFLK